MRIDTAELVELTQALVRIPSVFDVNRGLCEEPAARFLAELMTSWGWEPRLELVAPGRPNVITVVDGGLPGRSLLFEGHTDVVTEGDPARWSVDPFAAEISDGKIWGRGSADMKSGVAAMLLATRSLAQAGPFPGRITLACLVDEEGMMTGAKHFVASGHTNDIDAAIVCEPEAGEICNVAKGAVRLRVDMHGRMAHGAMPHHGDNPLPRLARLIAALEDLQSELQDEHGEHRFLGHPYVTPTVLDAGHEVQMNVIPQVASVWIDVRTIPGIDHGWLVQQVEERAAACGTAAVRVIDDRPVVDIPEDEAIVQAVWDAHAAVTSEPPCLGGVPGATDGTVLTSRGGIPSVVYGPGGKWIAHQVDEFVEIGDIERHAHVYAEAAMRFLSE